MSQVSASRDGLQDGCSPSLGHCWPRPANSGDPPPAWGRLRVLPSRPSSRSRSRFRRGLGQSSPEPAGQTNEPSEAPPSCPGRAPRAGNPDRAAAHLRFLCFPPGPAIALPRPPPNPHRAGSRHLRPSPWLPGDGNGDPGNWNSRD